MLTHTPRLDPDRRFGPLRVAVLCSDRAPGLMYLLNRAPERGAAFDIVCVVTSQRTFAEEVRVERRGIPTRVHPIDEFCAARGTTRFDRRVRAEYDADMLRILEPFFPDLVLLDGYLYLVTTPLLRAFPNRILNLHFSDLTLRRRDGSPLFPGVRAVRDALKLGCAETRATVHLVNEAPDAGAPIVLSKGFPASPLVEDIRALDAEDVFRAYVFAHQQWMLRTVSGPLVAAALQLVATGAVDLPALAGRSPQDVDPWLLDERGALMAPLEATAALALATV